MKNVKKIIALIAIVTMMVTVMGTGVVAFPDVAAGTPVYEAANTLASLGIIEGFEDGNFRPTENVTRAQMAAIITRALGLSGISSQVQTQFVDVPATHWASGYVATATGLGIVMGHGDGTFTPDASVTYEQVVAMVMRAIGYTPFARANGGFPIGYMVAASNVNVTRGITAQQTAAANRGLVARVVYNALSAPMMIADIWAQGGTANFIIANGENNRPYQTLLTQAFGVRRLVGQVVANRYTDFYNVSTINNDTDAVANVRVYLNVNDRSTRDYIENYGTANEFTFREGTSNIGALLGYNVIFYAQEETHEPNKRVISAVVDSGRNTVATFAIEDLVAFSTGTLSNGMQFARDGQRTPTTVRTTNETVVIYNGRVFPNDRLFGAARTDMFSIGGDGGVIFNERTNGTITALTLPGNNNNVSVIFVNSATVFVVDAVNVNLGRVTARNNPIGVPRTLNFDTVNFNISYSITRDGVEIGLDDIDEWDVLMVEYCTAGIDDGLFNIRVITNTVDGTITGISGSRFMIDGVAYELAHGVYPRAEDFENLGLSGRFFIDEDGRIAAVDENQGPTGNVAFQYGFVFGVNDHSDSFISRPAQIQVMLENGNVVVADFANSVTIRNWQGNTSQTMRADGSVGTAQTGRWAYWPLPQAEGIEFVAGQMIRFSTNAAGAINAIEFASPSNAATSSQFRVMNGGVEDDFEFDRRRNMMVRNPGANVVVSNDTLIFFIGRDAQDRAIASESRVGRVSALTDGASLDEVLFFDPNNFNEPAVMLVGNFTPEAPITTLALFDSVARMHNTDGEEIAAVTFWQNGQRTTVNTVAGEATTEALSGNFVRGTAFRYSTDISGDIDSIAEVFTASRANLARSIESPDFEIGPLWVRDTAEAGFYVYNFDGASGGSQIRMHIAPVNSIAGSAIRLGRIDNVYGAEWRNSFNIAVTNANTNFYAMDFIRTGAQILGASHLGGIDTVDTRIADYGATVRFGTGANLTLEHTDAPALEVRDWVVVLEVDNLATDVVIVRSTVRGTVFAQDPTD